MRRDLRANGTARGGSENKGRVMKLHLGCGSKYIPGFVHIDVMPFDHIDHISSIDSLPFIQNNTVDLIYNCHVLEHFKRADVKRVLSEWKRVLKPGGILRTSVPDFDSLSKIYTNTKELNLVIGALFGKQNYLYNIHYNVFDFKSLSNDLTEVGFVDIRKYDWRETEHADVDDYSQAYIPHMDKQNGMQVSLNVEAKKESA